MNITGNTILLTGGNSGIGRALAIALQACGNKVIITGRCEKTLDETTRANPGMESIALDQSSAGAIELVAADVISRFPNLNILINNAGIMKPEDLVNQPANLAVAEETIGTNLLGPIRLIACLSSHLQRQPAAAIINSSSGLAFVPVALAPTYCAAKAAIHSYTQSLRFQLRNSSVEVIELVPPATQTELMPGLSKNPRAMPLTPFIEKVMLILRSQPSPREICVEEVEFLRKAEANGTFETTFAMMNSHHE